MKKLSSLLVIIFAFTVTAWSQKSIEKVFRKYKNDDGIVALSFAGDLSNMVQNKDLNLKTKITNCELYMFSGKDNVSTSDQAKIKTALKTDNYESLINVRNQDVKASIYAISKGDALSKLYIEGKMDNKNVYVMLAGNIFLDELSKLNFDADGLKDIGKILGQSKK